MNPRRWPRNLAICRPLDQGPPVRDEVLHLRMGTDASSGAVAWRLRLFEPRVDVSQAQLGVVDSHPARRPVAHIASGWHVGLFRLVFWQAQSLSRSK